ncbi:MBL fold metallo-hydrolase [Fodinicola acaciae]|uniref:MBL fold metallo-hydrolase n=1 Tax=Fodinicola acaciae TaxID=2681555 RepID=UPI0013D4E5B1|nr:MBL fold metallo-hydrolase [Fodinicola acaciae]
MLVEIAEGVHVWREPVLDVNATVVVGSTKCLVVDTLSSVAQATRLATAVRAVTDRPIELVNTHVHFDHWYGNAAFGAERIWSQRQWDIDAQPIAAAIGDYGDAGPGFADELAAVDPVPPTHSVEVEESVDLGGRTAVLAHLGRGHTDHDLVVVVPDAHVAVCGDLVEQGAPPSFGDAYPLDWPATLAALAGRLTDAGGSWQLVPGHGAVVDQEFLHRQHGELASLEWLCRDGYGDGRDPLELAQRSPFGPEHSLVAIRRAYADLDGRA